MNNVIMFPKVPQKPRIKAREHGHSKNVVAFPKKEMTLTERILKSAEVK